MRTGMHNCISNTNDTSYHAIRVTNNIVNVYTEA